MRSLTNEEQNGNRESRESSLIFKKIRVDERFIFQGVPMSFVH